MNKLSLWIIFTVFILTSTSLPSTVSGESASLSLEPTLIEVPFVELDHGEIVVSVYLTINNVYDLKKFTLILTFNGKMLEYYTDHAGDWGYSGSRSTNPESGMVTMSGELTDGREISGSGTFYTFAFKVIGVGSSQILLQYIYLEDKSGSAIPYVISNDNATIEILPFEIWTDGEYAELKQAYDVLLDDFQTLNATYEALLSGYDSLNLTYGQLVSDYDSLNDEYEKLRTDYDNLKTEHSELKSDYDSLQSTYNSLSSEHDKLSEELVIKDDELSTNANLMYVFVITTIVLAATAAYFAKKKKIDTI